MTRNKGFTAIPRALLDQALCAGMGKRELHLWLLVARLTYGAQGREWVALRPADLSAVGIGPNHARACLREMLCSGLLEQNGSRDEYRVGTAVLHQKQAQAAVTRQERLGRLIARQLGDHTPQPADGSQNGAMRTGLAPETGRVALPKGEGRGSRYGNASTVPAWRFSRSLKRFVRQEPLPIDKVNTEKDILPATGRERP